MIQSSLEGCGVVSSGIFAKPLEIEIGCGKARFLLERARENPNIHFVGVERVSKWARIAGQRAESVQLFINAPQ